VAIEGEIIVSQQVRFNVPSRRPELSLMPPAFKNGQLAHGAFSRKNLRKFIVAPYLSEK